MVEMLVFSSKNLSGRRCSDLFHQWGHREPARDYARLNLFRQWRAGAARFALVMRDVLGPKAQEGETTFIGTIEA